MDEEPFNAAGKSSEEVASRPRRRFQTFSIKSLLMLMTLVAFGIFLCGATTTTAIIPHDKGAYLGGIPKPGDQVSVFVDSAFGKKTRIAQFAVVLEKPKWSFRGGVAMRLDMKTRRYQAWLMRLFQHHRIVRMTSLLR